MAFDYHRAKVFFFEKLARDLEGHGRIESAFYHTAKMIYDAGCTDVAAEKEARIAELEAALTELVDLKDLREYGEAIDPTIRPPEYERRKGPAWCEARRVLDRSDVRQW